jgi:hypothetical protein
MTPIRFRVRAWESWRADSESETRAGEKVGALPASLRRRVSSLGKHALAAAWALPNSGHARLVLSSRHGEFSRTLSLLEAAASGAELSPSDFTLSVHHALIGLLSIAQVNRRGHIAVASGEESFCYGLLEAIACLKENPGEPVVLMHFDEPLPGPFARFTETNERPIVLALELSAEDGDGFALASEPGSGTLEIPHAAAFADFLEGDAAAASSAGAERTWRWTRDA